jgi:ribosome biogenesis GTPase / thiamine phosphate phosphatase
MTVQTGIVTKSTGSWYTVRNAYGELFDCRIKGKLRIKGIRTTNPLAVGDTVTFEALNEWSENDYQMGVVTTISERRNYIIRKSINLSKESQIIAANVDQALLVVTLKHPTTTTTFIDRFLASAEAYNIPATLVFNKIDTYTPEEMEQVNELFGTYVEIGYPCIGTSARTGQGLDQLMVAMTGKVNVVAGHSGVGKSTLINTIDPRLNLKTGEISEMHKQGKHTTTFAEMFDLSFGGHIIDTPGIRGFGLIDMQKDEISHYFREIFSTSANCKFYNCTHNHEPGCAVRQAVEEGLIAPSRYESYLSILLGDDDRYRQA